MESLTSASCKEWVLGALAKQVLFIIGPLLVHFTSEEMENAVLCCHR